MRYAVVPLVRPANPEALQRRVSEVDGAAYTQYHPLIYFVFFSGTPGDLAKRLHILSENGDGEGGTPCIIMSVGRHSGFGNRDLWSWLKDKE